LMRKTKLRAKDKNHIVLLLFFGAIGV